MLGKSLGEIRIRDAPDILIRNPFKSLRQAFFIMYDLAYGKSPFFEISIERGLSSSAENHGAPVVTNEFYKDANAGIEIFDRQHLSLIKNNHTASDVMQLSGTRSLAREDRFEKLNVGGNH